MAKSSSARSGLIASVLRYVLVMTACLAFGIALGYAAHAAVDRLGALSFVKSTPSSGHLGRQQVSLDVQTVPQQIRAVSGTVTTAKATSGIPDEGSTYSPTSHAGPNVQDSRLMRPVQADNLRVLSSVRTVSHLAARRSPRSESVHWEYCGNPQCRLCYPVDLSDARRESTLTSDTGLPDMPQGYCKRHPQSRDCKPIVSPSTPPTQKPLPKATDPPVVASAGFGGIGTRESLAWTLVCLFFTAWLVSGVELSRLKQDLRTADKLLGSAICGRTDAEKLALASELKLGQVVAIIQTWLDKQGHDRCWYYPELFRQLASVLDLKTSVEPKLPSLAAFRAGCERYQTEEYRALIAQFRSGDVEVLAQAPGLELDVRGPHSVQITRDDRVERRWADGTVVLSTDGGVTFRRICDAAVPVNSANSDERGTDSAKC